MRVTRIKAIDSHTGGEPTRVVVAGGPDLGRGPMAERAVRFREQFDDFRSATVNEPRGNDAIVGALLCEPSDPACDAGVIFYNNVGISGNVRPRHHRAGGHAGAHGARPAGKHRAAWRLPCGNVEARLNANGSVTIRNVASYRSAGHVPVEAPGIGTSVRRYRLGRQLVFPVQRARTAPLARPRGRAHRFRLAHPPGPGSARHHRRRGRR